MQNLQALPGLLRQRERVLVLRLASATDALEGAATRVSWL